MSVNKKKRRLWSIIIVVSSLALLLGSVVPFLPYIK